MAQCVLLNADYTFLNVVSWKRAMGLIVKGKVQVIKYSDRIIKTAEGMAVKVPMVMRLMTLIRSLYRTRVHFSKRNILVRDGFKCAYCGADRGPLTIDHIIPRSRGGKTNFENCVACCKKCNTRKGSKTPSEARMYLKKRAYQPTISEFLRMRIRQMGIDELLEELGVY